MIVNFSDLLVEKVEDPKSAREYLVRLNRKIRFLSQNIDEDNFPEEEYRKFYENKTAAVSLCRGLDRFQVDFENYQTGMETRLHQTADEIGFLVKKGDVTNQVNVSGEKIRISGNKLRVRSENFTLDGDGNLAMKGTINAAAGKFGNFVIAMDNGKPYLRGDGNSVIDAAGLSGTNIRTGDLNIHTDRDADGTNIDFTSCRIATSSSTYLGWFYTENVDISGNMKAICGYADSVKTDKVIRCYDVWSEQAGVAWSDQRLKKDICKLNGEAALQFLMKLRPVMYRMKGENGTHYGLIAQEVLETGDPYGMVSINEEGGYVLNYGVLHGVILAAMKYQKEEMARVSLSIEAG